MFTNALISLSHLATKIDLDLRRDAHISYVGKIPTSLSNRLIPASNIEHITSAAVQVGISAYVVPEELVHCVPSDVGIIVSDRPLATAMIIHEFLCEIPDFLWQSFSSEIDDTAIIMPGAVIASQNVKIGPGTVVGPNTVICERTIIGAECCIGATAVVGMEAFELKAGVRPKTLVRQAGGVMIEDHVSILPGCCIARSTFGGFTLLGAETKIDALSYIAHDCVIGKRVTICASCDVSGRVTIGDDTYLGPNCTVSNGIRIGSKSTISLGSVVTRDVEDGVRVSGNFALKHENWLRLIRKFR